jgi:hypothetical protein
VILDNKDRTVPLEFATTERRTADPHRLQGCDRGGAFSISDEDGVFGKICIGTRNGVQF